MSGLRASPPAPTFCAGRLALKTPWHDGITQRVMSPLEFMQRLAARVQRTCFPPAVWLHANEW